MCSCGFCLLNNVAIAAAHARQRYSPASLRHLSTAARASLAERTTDAAAQRAAAGVVERVAIVDFDIHHGNGTEEIVRNLTPNTAYAPLPASWAPQPYRAYKPWRDNTDAEAVLFSSVHMVAGERFYPGGGEDTQSGGLDGVLPPPPRILNVALSAACDRSPPGDPASRARLGPKQREEAKARASAEFRHKMATRIIPALAAHETDLLLISAGFDGHENDLYHFLSDEDYHWFTEEMVKVMSPRGGRIVSVMEGGYSLNGPAVYEHTSGRVWLCCGYTQVLGSS